MRVRAGAHAQREPKKGRSRLEARSDMIELAEDDGTDGAARGGEAAPGTIPSKVGTYPLAAGPKKLVIVGGLGHFA